MQKPLFRLAPTLFLLAMTLGFQTASAEKLLTLESTHYRVAFAKKYSQLGGEVLQVAESVWPTLAKAYDSYNHYERIDIVITDDGDDANGFAIYNFSRVMIFAPHMDWVMRNRQMWVRNVVTHELAHIFSLRRAAILSPVDAVDIYGSTYNYADRINYAFQIPWIPLVAPTWYVEGIAQFEAYMNGNDSWDSQRDMVLRDAYLTGTLPSLDFIETFERDEDWTQSERCYNTGYAFLIYLKDRFGAEKVRDLARPKPIFNFSYSVRHAFGRELPDLYDDFLRSLTDRYADFKEIPTDSLADKDMHGGYQQDLAISKDGKFMAWIGNDEDRRAPMNWIFWKKIGSDTLNKSDKPADKPASSPAPANPSPGPSPKPEMAPSLPSGITMEYGPMSGLSRQHLGNPLLGLARNHIPNFFEQPYAGSLSGSTGGRNPHAPFPGTEADRSRKSGSTGLEFNHDNTRLLTTRQDENATYTDIWEYEFLSKEDEEDKWHRLTWEERAAYPSYHPTRNLIVYSRKKTGSSNLTVLDSTGRAVQLTNFSNGEQVYNPRYNPKGDSIYFTLGIQDKEAIAAIRADAPGFDPFLGARDSALFPDSLNYAKTQHITFITPMRRGSIRNLRFANDTLFWSSNSGDSVYSVFDIFAKVPGDSAVYRATHVSGQALEALPHDGTLYYQGYRRQRFQIYKQPLALSRTKDILSLATDSVPLFKPKKLDYATAFDTSEYYGTKVALDITPYLALQPQFISGDKSYTDVALGLSLTFGEAYGGWMQGVSGAITKRANLKDPLNYQLSYEGAISANTIRHTSFAWTPDLYYSLYHDVLQQADRVVPISDGGFIGPDSVSVKGRFSERVQFSRYAASVASPLPYDFLFDAGYWRQTITQELDQSAVFHNFGTGKDSLLHDDFSLRDAQQHRHFNSGLTWSFFASKRGTFLPTGGGLSLGIHKWWAAYETGDVSPLDSGTSNQFTQRGDVPPTGVLNQAKWDPWSTDMSLSFIWSYLKAFSLFATAEGGAYLNKEPVTTDTVHVTPNQLTTVDNLAFGLWVMSNRIGYYKLGGYPYNFGYRGRDIMEGSSFAFGQFGIQIPIKMGAFIPDLPTTSLKQFMITGLGEWGATLASAPDKIYHDLDQGKHYLLLDYGVRASMNFHLYHQLPFTVFAQVFIPWNRLSANNLYWDDYPHSGLPNPDGSVSAAQIANGPADRQNYINQVKDPRYFIGFNLGTF